MIGLLKFLENQQLNFTINLNDIKAALQHIEKMGQEYHNKTAQNKENFSFDKFLNEIKVKLAEYPKINMLITILGSRKVQPLYIQYKAILDWIGEQDKRSNFPTTTDWLNFHRTHVDRWRQGWHLIMDYINVLEHKDERTSNDPQPILDESHANMVKIEHLIREAIDRIESWHTKHIIIRANAAEDERYKLWEAATDAHITLGDNEDSPSFSLFFIDGKMEIDDILEGGDSDFFQTAVEQADYFNLIAELKKPGSTSGKGKILTLYTARPVKDRGRYQDATTVPANIFLTDSPDHVDGLANDLSSGERRDIWKVRINSKYVILTKDHYPRYYQVTKESPVEKINLY